jgi:hypothetical protein
MHVTDIMTLSTICIMQANNMIKQVGTDMHNQPQRHSHMLRRAETIAQRYVQAQATNS